MEITKDEILKHCDDFLTLVKESKKEDIIYFKIDKIEVSIERRYLELQVEERLENLDVLIDMLKTNECDEHEILASINNIKHIFYTKINHSGYVFDSYVRRKQKHFLDKKTDPSLIFWWKIIKENYPKYYFNHFDISFFDDQYDLNESDDSRHIDDIDINLSNNAIAILIKDKLIELKG